MKLKLNPNDLLPLAIIIVVFTCGVILGRSEAPKSTSEVAVATEQVEPEPEPEPDHASSASEFSSPSAEKLTRTIDLAKRLGEWL